jgi:hypothetical protein
MDMNSELIIYTTVDGLTRVDVTFDNDTVWLSLEQMSQLFQRDKSTISRHIKNVFEEGELSKEATVANFATVQIEGNRQVERNIEHFNLDVIISVGYRVKSQRGVQFRIWATNILKEYMKKGFAMDDVRLKNLGGSGYFKELIERIRDIRASEKVFYRQVLEIYATSVDYVIISRHQYHLFRKMVLIVHTIDTISILLDTTLAGKTSIACFIWPSPYSQPNDPCSSAPWCHNTGRWYCFMYQQYHHVNHHYGAVVSLL